jgi:hypothetical protein
VELVATWVDAVAVACIVCKNDSQLSMCTRATPTVSGDSTAVDGWLADVAAGRYVPESPRFAMEARGLKGIALGRDGNRVDNTWIYIVRESISATQKTTHTRI